MLYEVITVILGNRQRTTIISHELAHAWTGNLVTNSTWEDFWLNEGWTTYAQMRITRITSYNVCYTKLLRAEHLANFAISQIGDKPQPNQFLLVFGQRANQTVQLV